MAPDDDAMRPERDQTDEGLRTERTSTDKAIAERLEGIEDDAAAHVDRARGEADAAVAAARRSADQPGPAVARRRTIEDAAIQTGRAAADEALGRDLEEQIRVLSTLLPLEREKTDLYLLTERARADDALANRDDFLGVVSHDLRNLLSGIVLSAQVLSDAATGSAPDLEPRTVANTERILRYAARMNRLIGDLLDVTSIDAGKLAVHMVRTDAATLLAEAVDAFAASAAEKGIALVLDRVDGPLVGELDHDRLFQVLANLITNAIKFTPKGGRITVRGTATEDGLRISVADTGVGIPADQLEAVFERFWQVGKKDRRGLGLGLHISRCIVEAHGGTITATSEVGQGSELALTIPHARGAP